MTMDEKINLAHSLAKFLEECSNIELNDDVEVQTKAGYKYSFKYATLGQIREHIRPLLARNGLSYSQSVEDGSMVTTIRHIHGESFTSKLPFLGEWKSAQELGSLVTYTRRYGLVTALGLVAEDDDDGNAAAGNTAKKKEKPQATMVGASPIKLLDGDKVLSGVARASGKSWYAIQRGENKIWLTAEQFDQCQDVLANKLTTAAKAEFPTPTSEY